VIGELACGNLKTRARVLADLAALQRAGEATHEEVLRLIEDRKLERAARPKELTTEAHRLKKKRLCVFVLCG
jgi:hypothetical protein